MTNKWDTCEFVWSYGTINDQCDMSYTFKDQNGCLSDFCKIYLINLTENINWLAKITLEH